MGYTTHYSIETDGDTDAIIGAIRKVSGYGSILFEDSVKWYDNEKDCKEVSLKFPDTLITIKGEGEDPSDIWYQYFKNGKSQYCPAIITFEPFDESKMK